MYHIYHTRGVILGSVPIGESNRFYKIFTEEMGLVHATAQAVREAKSKLRYSLQDFSWASFDLVKGREVWRITSAQGIENETWGTPTTSALPGSPDLPRMLGRSGLPKWSGVSEHDEQSAENRILFARVCALVSRLVHGEERHNDLFGEIMMINKFLQDEELTHPRKTSFEALATLRVLTHLGYFDPKGYGDFVVGTLSRDLLDEFESVRAEAILRINEALKASHL